MNHDAKNRSGPHNFSLKFYEQKDVDHMMKSTNCNFHLIGENPVLYDAEMNPIDPKS